MSLDRFFDAVRSGPLCSDKSSLFNPWVDFDADNDLSSSSPAHRFEHLQAYMRERESSARFLLIAEAPGYCGCKFSGLAMTSERALLASDQDLLDSHYFLGPKHRTSKFSPAISSMALRTVPWLTLNLAANSPSLGMASPGPHSPSCKLRIKQSLICR